MPDLTFERFGGLDLQGDSQEVGAERAVSCLNVSYDRSGRVRTRDGYSKQFTDATLDAPTNMYAHGPTVVMAAFDSDSIQVVSLASGASIADVVFAEETSHFASLTNSRFVYFTQGQSGDIGIYDTVAHTFSTIPGIKGDFLAVQPLDDRLVVANASSNDQLLFSDPGAPETFTAGNDLTLSPTGLEDITGMGVFNDQLYVFKRSKFFVFYGNSTDSTGGAVFNYRMVDTGIGVHQGRTSGGGSRHCPLVASHSTGLYFVGVDGVYRTTGGPPVRVSDPVSPLFQGANLPVPAPFSAVVSDPVESWSHLSIAGQNLYLTDRSITLVMDLTTGAWTVFDWPASCFVDGNDVRNLTGVGDHTYLDALILGGVDASNGFVAISGNRFTTDAGSAISWHHQSGFYDLGSQTSKRVRQTVLWGSGSPTVSVLTDHGSTDGNAAAVTLGTAPAIARGWHRKAYRGVLLSHRLSGSSVATVHRIAHAVADQRAGE